MFLKGSGPRRTPEWPLAVVPCAYPREVPEMPQFPQRAVEFSGRPEPPEARDERGNAGNAEADNGHGANEGPAW